MKNLFLFIVLIGLLSCQQKIVKEVLITEVIITGSISNPTSDIAIVRISGTTSLIMADTCKLDSGGNFATIFNINGPMFGSFKHGKERTGMFFTPGDSIHIELDTEEFDETVTYSGVGNEVNNFLAAKFLIKEGFPSQGRDMYMLDLDTFTSRTDSIKMVLLTNLNNFQATATGISQTFFDLENAAVEFTWALQRMNYPGYYAYYTKNDSIDIPKEYDNYLGGLNLDDSTLLACSEYRKFMTKYTTKQAEKMRNADTTTWDIPHAGTASRLKTCKDIFTSGPLRDYLLFKIMDEQIKYRSINDISALLSDFEKSCKNEEFKAQIKGAYAEWQKLAAGAVAPDFTYPNIEGDTISLSDFRGKYVYIDVWATWCGPCKKEIPFLAKLEEEYADKNIVFISVSIDDTAEPWKKMVTEKQLKGIQLFAEGWKSKIAESYMIKSIPRFILIDTDGSIIDVRAPRPSGGIKKVFDALEEKSS